MAAAFPFTVSTTGRLLFRSCFMNSPERRRKVVSDWMSLVMSSMGTLRNSTFLGAIKISHLRHSGNASASIGARRYGNHPSLLKGERAPPPLNPVHSKAGEPDKKRKQIAHRQKPNPPAQHPIPQPPNAHGPRHCK